MIEQKIPNEIEFFSPDSKPFDKSYGEWTVKWWQWALGTPKPINPVVDQTGKNANVNQPADVWYLAGKFGDENKNFPQRQCTVPAGRAILFPM